MSDVPRHRHRRAQLLLRARGPGAAPRGDLDLSPWRLALNGAEPIDPDSVEAFCAPARRYGLDAGAAFSVYGMAEATLAVTFPDAGHGHARRHRRPPRARDRALRRAGDPATPTAPRRLAAARPHAAAGSSCGSCDPETGRALGDREVGEMELRGASVTPGYYRDPTPPPRRSATAGCAPATSAYLVDGELVVCGRIKDVIIVGGRNVFPEDIERAAAGVDGVRAGNVIAFGDDRPAQGPRGDRGGGRDQGRRRPTRSARRRRRPTVTDAVGIPPPRSCSCAPGTLPKTSSGKLQRSLCRQRCLDEQLSSF